MKKLDSELPHYAIIQGREVTLLESILLQTVLILPSFLKTRKALNVLFFPKTGTRVPHLSNTMLKYPVLLLRRALQLKNSRSSNLFLKEGLIGMQKATKLKREK